ncbi:MAG: DUF4857 domain-containing protein [Campylobacterota bacterium]|nr:DUF4857 domain-containing protein [Campylobacterota bacterium]
MVTSILKKEWIKLRFYILGIFIAIVCSLGYFWFNLDFSFSTVEPESMMWYKFTHLQEKPYFYLSYIFLSFGFIISFAQFLPEKIQNRIKIMAHLPLNMRDSLFLHLAIGIGFIVALITIYSISLLFILLNYYPQQIIQVAFKDTIAYSFAAIVLYIGLSSVIVERNSKAILFKTILIALFISLFLKNQYFAEDTLWLLFLFFIPFAVLDSFYSVKQQKLDSIFYKVSLALVTVCFLFLSYINYTTNYQKTFNKYYIFYSNVIKDFVYQKNFGDHRFEYGVKDKKTFDRITYESYLPFVYWRDLDIQRKLPLKLDDKIYDKKTIKSSRLGFSYNTNLLKKQEVQLYPLLNPDKKQGMIKFPEEVFGIRSKQAVVYDFDHGLNKHLSEQLTTKLNNNGFKYPALNIWGKATNMKPHDKGYLVQDSNKNLFNIRRRNGVIRVKQIPYPKDINLAFIKISENKQDILTGYAIDTNSNFYLLTWNFKFIKLNLPKFDHKTMKLKLISNPMNYLIRYDDADIYYGVVFDKSYKKISSVELN